MLIHADQPEAAPRFTRHGDEEQRIEDLLARDALRYLTNAKMARVVGRLEKRGAIADLAAPELPLLEPGDQLFAKNLARWEELCRAAPTPGKIPRYKLESSDGWWVQPSELTAVHGEPASLEEWMRASIPRGGFRVW